MFRIKNACVISKSLSHDYPLIKYYKTFSAIEVSCKLTMIKEFLNTRTDISGFVEIDGRCMNHRPWSIES